MNSHLQQKKKKQINGELSRCLSLKNTQEIMKQAPKTAEKLFICWKCINNKTRKEKKNLFKQAITFFFN